MYTTGVCVVRTHALVSLFPFFSFSVVCWTASFSSERLQTVPIHQTDDDDRGSLDIYLCLSAPALPQLELCGLP